MHNRLTTVARAFVLAAITLGPAAATFAQLPPLIPRETLFGNPERVSPRLSPDGKRLAWIAPDKKNVLQVWVKTIGADDDKVVTADKKRGIRTYSWSEDNKTLLYAQDNDGDENFHVYGVDLDNGNGARLHAVPGRARPIAASEALDIRMRSWSHERARQAGCSTSID